MTNWIILYLILYSVIWLGSLYEDIKAKRGLPVFLLELLTGLFIYCFAFVYAYPALTHILAPMVLPMLAVGIWWECYAGIRDMREFKQEQKQDPENTEEQTFWLVALSASLLFLISLPGYYMGYVIFTRL